MINWNSLLWSFNSIKQPTSIVNAFEWYGSNFNILKWQNEMSRLAVATATRSRHLLVHNLDAFLEVVVVEQIFGSFRYDIDTLLQSFTANIDGHPASNGIHCIVRCISFLSIARLFHCNGRHLRSICWRHVFIQTRLKRIHRRGFQIIQASAMGIKHIQSSTWPLATSINSLIRRRHHILLNWREKLGQSTTATAAATEFHMRAIGFRLFDSFHHHFDCVICHILQKSTRMP